MIIQLMQVSCIAFAEGTIGKSFRLCPDLTRSYQIVRYIDSQDVGSKSGFRDGRVAITRTPRSSTLSPLVMPSWATSAEPLSRILSAIFVKSPFSHNALFGFICLLLHKFTHGPRSGDD